MRDALDRSDRTAAMVVWAGVFTGGPIVPLVVWASFGQNKAALARHHALVSLAMWATILVVYVPVMIWAFFFDGSWSVYIPVAIVMAIALYGVSIVMFVRAWRAPLATEVAPHTSV